MDLKSLMNDGPPEEDKKKSPDAQRNGAPLPPPPLDRVNTQPTPGIHGLPSAQQTPLFTPSSAGPWRPPGSQGMTPIQTPGGGPGQYPFPPSAGGYAQNQHRPSEGYPAGTPLARPPSHSYPHPHQSPSQPPPIGLPQALHVQPNSVSPTPSSHHSHTPQSVRQSPMSIMSHPPHQPPSQHQYAHQQSQPSTPLGPPPLHHGRSVGFQEHSPFHARSYSGASNGIPIGSPATYPPSANVYGSPTAYHRPSPQHRRTSDFQPTEQVRERTESVSPKTQVRPRPSLSVSQHSSQQENYSRGSSLQHNSLSQAVVPQNHVPPGHQNSGASQPYEHSQPPNLAAAPQIQPQPQPAPPYLGRTESSLSATKQESAPHSSTNIAQDAATAAENDPPELLDPQLPDTMKSSPATSALKSNGKQLPMQKKMLFPEHASHQTEHHQPSHQSHIKSEVSLKRSADPEPMSDQRPAKQTKRRPTEKPIWAKLSKHNPRYDPLVDRTQQTNGQSHANGIVTDERKAWEHNPPLDQDLIHARKVLGRWEKTFKWNTPYPDNLKVVQDWLYMELSKLKDVGNDPKEGTIEIEAKIGTLTRDGERYRLPIESMTPIKPSENGKLRFESSMSLADHKAWNSFINDTIRETLVPGRVGMTYTHKHERDSFHTLSPLGLQSLPPSLQRFLHPRNPPRLRVTRHSKKGEPEYIKAIIVKLKVADLHIYNPGYAYDCRISINVEVNLDRPGLDLNSLINHSAPPAEIDRFKDRLSYSHLAYSIDLTKVDRQGLQPSYELELEVDSKMLRQQMRLLEEGREHAFGDVVSGFLDNATFLMRQARPGIS